MATNLFIVLPAPSANGSGAWTDCTTLGALRTITVGGTVDGSITIEISNEAVASSPAPLVTIQDRGQVTLPVAARWMRATVSGYKSGVPDILVGGSDDGCIFANLAAPAGDGVGAGTDVTAMGAFKTVTIGGTFRGSVTIESSEDNAQYFPLKTVQRPGQFNIEVVAQFMRVRRGGVKAPAGLPIVNIGSDETGVNPNPDFIDPRIQRYTAVGGEDDFNVVLTVPRVADTYSVWPTQAGMAAIVGIDCPDLLAGDRTTLQFRVVTSAPLTAGDIIDFLIAGR